MTEARPLSPSDRRDWLRLARSENVGPVTFRQLLARFGSAAAALAALPALAARGGARRPIRVCPPGEAERELERIAAVGGELLCLPDASYPRRLAEIADAPPAIIVRGHASLLDRPAIAMVGARNASALGSRFASDMAAALGRQGLVVVSGLARGIDTAAHRGSLPGGTIAVVAGGVDVVYPAENQALQDEIAERGLVLSEQPPGTVPQARHFPRRNRLISGLALGVLVVEAARRSGSLITAECALEQGREVMAVPGFPMDPRHQGTNDLIRNGATLVQQAEDVLEAIAPQLRAPLGERRRDAFVAPERRPLDEGELAAARPEVLERLGYAPVGVDELVRQCQLTPAAVLTVLLELELAGRLERHPGNQVSLLAAD